MFKKYLFLAFLTVGMFAVNPSKILACVCLINNNPLAQKVASNLKNADAVFSGKVSIVAYRKLTDSELQEKIKSNINKYFFKEGAEIEVLTVRIKVIRWWKGYKSKEIILLTETYRNSEGSNSTSSCEKDFKNGEEFLFFTSGKDQYNLQRRACSLTNSLEKSKEVLEVLGRGYAPNTPKSASR